MIQKITARPWRLDEVDEINKLKGAWETQKKRHDYLRERWDFFDNKNLSYFTSTELAPEDYREVMLRGLEVMAAIISKSMDSLENRLTQKVS